MIIFVGEYFLGQERVALFADTSNSGGNFTMFSDKSPPIHPKDTKHAKIVVGFVDNHRWREVFEVLLHEVHEFAYTRIRGRFVTDDRDNCDNAAYSFVMTHAQFTQATQWASWFLCPAMPDLCAAWKKWNRKRKK